MKSIQVLLLIFSALSMVACSTYGYKTAIGERTYPPVDYHKVKLLFAAPSQPYETIGIVSTEGGIFATPGDMYQKLLKSAALLGADAVIVAGEGSRSVVMPGTEYTTAQATASGNTVYGSSTTTYSPTTTAAMPNNKGFAIKFTK